MERYKNNNNNNKNIDILKTQISTQYVGFENKNYSNFKFVYGDNARISYFLSTFELLLQLVSTMPGQYIFKETWCFS